MAERERATFPFAVEYHVEEEPREGWREADSSFDATVAWESGRESWHGVRQNRGPREEQCWARFGPTWWFVEREPSWFWWRGKISSSPGFEWPLLPIDFGLEHASEPLSAYLDRPSARIHGRERVAQFDCVVVLFDWVHPETARIQHPLMLWLAVGHDYYPVQVVQYMLEPQAIGESLTIDGEIFSPAWRRVVDELESVGRVRFPVRARQLPGSRDPREMRMTADLDTLRIGPEVEDDAFALPNWMYVVDVRDGTPYCYTPLGGISLSFPKVFLYCAVAVVVVLVVLSRRKRKRQRKVDERTVWDE